MGRPYRPPWGLRKLCGQSPVCSAQVGARRQAPGPRVPSRCSTSPRSA